MFDDMLTTVLVLILPAYQLWRSLVRRNVEEAKIARYRRSMIIGASLSLGLAADWAISARPIADLGLDFPVSQPGLIGLGLAAILLGSLVVLMKLKPPKENAAAAALLPVTTAEKQVFIGFSLLIGSAWELLYRGYLLWMLTPLIGPVGAVAVAATSYGIAHGFKEWKSFAASLVSATVFTTAYALTGSLWWLIIVHVGLPLCAVFVKQPSKTQELAEQPL